MVIWCRIANGEVVEATPDDRKGIKGWVLADDQSPVLADGEEYGAATYTVTKGRVVMIRDAVPAPNPNPLTDHEQLVALLAAKEILSLDEAENLTGKRAELAAEAEAWAVAEVKVR